MNVKTYRKKPVTVEAMRYDGSSESIDAICEWSLEHTKLGEPVAVPNAHEGKLIVHTLEGTVYAPPGDYIIRGVQGEFYPCKPDIFAATFEEVEGR